MNVGVVSDTHGQALFARQAVRLLEELDVELIIHCGDIGSVEIVSLFDRWPTHFVLGNVDDPRELEEAIRASGQSLHGRFGSLEAAGSRIAFLHGDDLRLLRETITGGGYDLVCHGHTHVHSQHREGTTTVLNPGALYRANPHTFALVEVPGMKVTRVAL